MRRKTVLLGVTADQSLGLMSGFPEFLSSQGWEVHVVSNPGPRLRALGRTQGVHAHSLGMVRQPSPLRDLSGLYRWVTLLSSVRPDVSFVGTPKAGLLGSIACYIMRVPRRIYILRGLRLETVAGPGRWVLTWLERLAMACSHTVIAVSPSLMHEAVNLKLVSRRKICVLGRGSSNGVDRQRFRPNRFSDEFLDALRAEHSLSAEFPIVLFVGRICKDKGVEQLFSACRILIERGVTHQLLLVGGVEDEELLRGLTGESRIARAVVAVGSVEDSAPYYQLADILCLPTMREGFPNVVLEAAASARPVVTTDATGAVDSVVDSETGFVVPAGSSAAMAAKLELLINDPALRQKMGECGAMFVRENFDAHDVWRRTEECFYG